MRNLSPNMERYCCSRANGITQKAAYRASYVCAESSDNTVSREASLLEADPKIAQRIKEIRNEAAKDIMWEIQDAARPLLEVLEQTRPVFARKAANDEIDNSARLAITESIRILNELFGMDGTQSVDTDGGVTIVDDIGD